MCAERKAGLIKNNIPSNVCTPKGKIKTLVSFMMKAISNEHTWDRSKTKVVRIIFFLISMVVRIIWLKVRPTCKTKDF